MHPEPTGTKFAIQLPKVISSSKNPSVGTNRAYKAALIGVDHGFGYNHPEFCFMT